jgi:GT2 family glycosyltransferase
MDKKIKLAILIPVFNNLDFTKRCLERLEAGIERADNKLVEPVIIISDDGSTDGTGEWLSKNKKEVVVLQGDGNLWWSGGINLAARYAVDVVKSDYILWWNNDIEPEDDYFKNLYNRILNNPDKNVIGSKVFMKGKNKVWGYGGYFNQKNGAKGMYGNWQDDSPEFNQPKLVDWLPGMGSVFASEVFTEVGYLDVKRFPQYHGDSDYTLRAKKKGYSITVYPDLVLFNDVTNSGLIHDNTVKVLGKSLSSIKSNYNIKKEWLFYKTHGESIGTYRGFFSKFGKYIGGFLKWKILNLFGVKRKVRQL